MRWRALGLACLLAFGAGCTSVPRLIGRLDHESPKARASAAFDLYWHWIDSPDPGRVLDAIPALTEALTDESVDVRRTAAMALERIGPAAKSAIPALITTLKGDDEEMRSLALRCLTDIGPEEDCVLLLVELLRDKSPRVRKLAAWTLGSVGPGARVAVPALVEALADDEFLVRKGAARGLGGIGPDAKAAVPALIGALDDEDERVRIAAAGALVKVEAKDDAAVPGLLGVLRLKGQHPRVTAAKVLAAIGPKAKGAVPALTDALRDKDSFVRGAAAAALGAIGPEARPAIPALARMMEKDEWSRTSSAAALALGGIGPEALPALRSALEHDSHNVRLSALNALCLLGPEGIEPLIAASEEDRFAVVAVLALGTMGPKARPAVGRLKAMLRHEQPIVRTAAAAVLFGLGEEKIGLAALVSILESPDARAASSAARVLGGIGPRASTALPALRRALDHHDPRIRHDAAGAIHMIADEEAGFRLLVEALRDRDSRVRRSAVLVIGDLKKNGLRTEDAIPALVEALRDRDYRVPTRAAWSLRDLGEKAVPVLADALEHENRNVRERAAKTLGDIGPGAKAAFPALVEALRDEDKRVRKTAARALRMIRLRQ